MQVHVMVIAALLLTTPLSKAPPEQAIEVLLRANHGLSPMASQDLRDLWAEMRRNPQPYLPHLMAYVTLERIEATQEPYQLLLIENAVGYLTALADARERERLVALLWHLQVRRDHLLARIRALSRNFHPLTPMSEREAVRALARHEGPLLQVEQALLRNFAGRGDPRLRDMLLARLDYDEDMLERYLDYFEATGLQRDFFVRLRLERLRQETHSPVTKEHLDRLLLTPSVGEPWF